MLVYYVIIPLLVNLTLQAIINFTTVYFLNKKYLKLYKYISYYVFIALAFVISGRSILKSYYALSLSGTYDPASAGFDIYSYMYWIGNCVLMILFQILFNQVYLKKVALKQS